MFVTVVSAASAATFTVTTTADSGAGSLRASIVSANAAGGTNTIDFSIAGSGVQTISPSSALPNITGAVTIDGTSEPGFSGTPLIVLDGSYAGAGVDGLTLESGAAGSTVEGLAIDNFDGDGIDLNGSSNAVVEGDYIGVDASGTYPEPNGLDGVLVADATTGATIGGTSASQLNVISGNGLSGVEISGSGTATNTVAGDLVGLSASGSSGVPNQTNGVTIDNNASDNTIGGAAAGAADVISGNADDGVEISSDADANTVAGDLVGVDSSDSMSVANGADGVGIDSGATDTTVGGTAAADADVISGNGYDGVEIAGASSTSNIVEGDMIGVDATGGSAIGNGSDGVELDDSATLETIGGTTSGSGDVISGNASNGVELNDAGTDTVEGNLIGVGATGATAIANSLNGVELDAGAASNTIGGTAAGAVNVISGNNEVGVKLTDSGTDSNTVEGNEIGVDATGSFAVANDSFGVDIESGAASNTVGGTAAGSADVVSGNGDTGIEVNGSDSNTIEGDLIGLDSSGSFAIGNAHTGVGLFGSTSGNVVGGTTTAARDVIAGNGTDGIDIAGAGAVSNTVEGDYIGVDITGTTAIANAHIGVSLAGGATNNVIGGTASGARDVISGNSTSGVQLSGSGTAYNLVEGDYIGVDTGDSTSVANGAQGVLIVSGANANTIGGTAAGSGDVISGNGANGVEIAGSSASSNTVEGDDIGVDGTGSFAIQNADNGVEIASAATSNTIGGTASGAADVISGNSLDGVELTGSGTESNTVKGDHIGVDSTGTSAIANGVDGVEVTSGAIFNTIGGTAAAARNVISGNDSDGVEVDGSGSESNVIEGDYVGVDPTGTVALGNGYAGVALDSSASNNTIGGTSAGTSDVISGNGTDGVQIVTSDSNTIEGDLIGTNQAGTAAISNSNDGVKIESGATTNTIGGPASGDLNLISGNSGDGVELSGSGTETNTIENDHIGVDATDSAALGNGTDGVAIDSAASDNTVGGTAAGDEDVISANTGNGVEISGTGTDSNTVEGDDIGVDASVSLTLGNGADGVEIDSAASDNTVGGTAAGSGSVIANNGSDGVQVDGASSSADTILSDAIYANTNLGIELSTSANSSIATPVISAADTASGSTTISGTVPSGTTSVQIFENASCSDPEGAELLGTVTPTGRSWSTSVSALGNGKGITATGTGTAGTSQFSVCQATQFATSTSLAASSNPVAPGQPVTYTATVSPVPTGGTVAFTTGGSAITGCGAVAVDTSTGVASCQQSGNAAGPQAIQAAFSASGNFAASTSSTLSESVQYVTGTTLVSSATPSAPGQQVTYTATVSPAPSNYATVSFTDAGTTIVGCGSVAVTSGTATCAQTYTTAGTHQIQASFSGNSDDQSSTSASFSQAVQASPTITTTTTPAPTTTTSTTASTAPSTTGSAAASPTPTAVALASSPTAAVTGGQIIYTATITPVPAGSVVAFTDNGLLITGCEGVPVVGSTARCTTSSQAPGVHTIVASYIGDSAFGASTSPSSAETITPSVTLTGAAGANAAAVVKLACAAGSGGCPALAVLTDTGAGHPAMVVGQQSAHFTAGAHRAITVRLNASGRRRLAQKRRLRLHLTVYLTAHGARQAVRTVTVTITLADGASRP